MTQFTDRLEAIVHRCGGAIALSEGGVDLDYAGLWKSARRAASGLRAGGVGREDVVGIVGGRSIDLIVLQIGVWMAEAAWLVLDPELPRERLEFMVRDAGVRHGLACPRWADLGEELACRIVEPVSNAAEDVERSGRPDNRPENLAYVVYTSGSTGSPKGVAVEHRGVVSLLDAQISAFRLGPGSRVLYVLSPSFDASVSVVGTSLLSGATLCIEPDVRLAPSALTRTLLERRITHVDLPPSTLARLDPDTLPASLRTVVIGGEVCPPRVVRRVVERGARVVNAYGPTEATVCASLTECGPDWSRSLIGRPLPGVDLLVLDGALQLAAPGSPGELFIGGIGLARGYVGLPVLTRERFMVRDGVRLFRTGDRVVERAGEIEILGRVDRQLKVRGQLVAPEEVEARLLEHPLVRAAVVLEASGRLSAHVAGGPIDAQALRAWLLDRLPRSMVPEVFHVTEDLPRTSSGKFDRPALRTPTSEIERTLLALFREVLGREEIGVDEDLFALGGGSFEVIELVARSSSIGIALTPRLVYEAPSVADLARALERGANGIDRRSAALLDLEAHLPPNLEARRTTGSRAPSRAPPSRVLLTGGTGFLGARVLAELLRRSSARVTCLVRSETEAAARERLSRAAEVHGFELEHGRIEVALGDLERPRLGLDPDRYTRLSESSDAVFHLAAQVHMTHPYERLRASNVEGTGEVLRFTASGAKKALHFASTLSVFVATDRDRGRAMEADDLDETRWVYGGYAQTKWVAERMVQSARDHGLADVFIYRLGLVTGDSRTGAMAEADFLRTFLLGARAIGALPAADLRVDTTSVDYAAPAMVHIAISAEPGTYHLAGASPLSLAEIAASMREFGFTIAEVTPEDFERLARPVGARAQAARLALCRALGRGPVFEGRRTLDLFQATDIVFDDTRARAALAGSGLSAPVADGRLVERYLRRLGATRFLPPPGGDLSP